MENRYQEKIIVKEGNLIKKGHVRHNWKMRWFVLYNDGLSYYKSKKESAFKGEVNLRGCSIISPCPEYTKKEGVFRLIEHGGTEFLVQCTDKQTRDEWTSAVAAVIRNLEMIPESEKMTADESSVFSENAEEGFSQPSIFESKVTYMELLSAMQDKKAGIPLQSFEIDGYLYKHCFTGKDIVDWLLHWAFVTRRCEAAVACGELLEKAHLHPVGPLSRSSFKRKNARRIFCDDGVALYRFAAVTETESELDMIFEEDSSDSEDGSKPVVDIDLGDVVKEGFLLKKGHLRHNWKLRKFVLRDNPLSFLYFKPNKSKTPQGSISLKDSKIDDSPLVVVERESQCTQASCVKSASLKAFRHEFQITTKGGIVYQLKADSSEDKSHWIERIQLVCLQANRRCFSV